MTTLPLFRGFVPKNIIVRMPNWLGDFVMATPVLEDLNNFFPEAKITALCQGGVGMMLKENPHVDEILNFKKPTGWLRHQTHEELVNSLRQGDYDLGILLTHSFSSAWWFWRGHVAHRLGYSRFPRDLLLDFPIPLPKDVDQQHLVKTYKMLLSSLGIPVSKTSPKVYLSRIEKDQANGLLRQLGVQERTILIGINPGAAYGSAKCWPADHFKKLGQKLLNNPEVKLIFFGDQYGQATVEAICAGLPVQRVINLAGKTQLRELTALISACQLFLTNDSGPMHVASALGVPLIALFGSTSERTTGPYAGGTILHKHVACSPCYRRECPLEDFRCMQAIGVDEVYEAIEKLLK